MSSLDVKGDLHSYLVGARETLVWKLDGLGEYDIRRPLTPTGTNLLGLVKHNAGTQLRYFGEVFGRTHDRPSRGSPTPPSPTPNAGRSLTRRGKSILAAYRSACELADATIVELPLDAVGRVPWWGGDPVTLHHVLVHVTAETQRHAGHADIIRELHRRLGRTPQWPRQPSHRRPNGLAQVPRADRGRSPSRRRPLTLAKCLLHWAVVYCAGE